MRRRAFARWTSLNVRVTYTADVTSPAANKALKGPGTTCLNGVARLQEPGRHYPQLPWLLGHDEHRGRREHQRRCLPAVLRRAHEHTGAGLPDRARSRACYDNVNYYNYAIDMAAGSTNGFVYIFDPQFCATPLQSGTGDRWFGTATA